MSFITATNTEVLYCMPAPGAALATSVTKSVITANSTCVVAIYIQDDVF